jgi:hypothetical protein
MAFDDKIWNKPAINGDVAGIAINSTVGFYAIASALEKLSAKSGVDIEKEIEEIRKFAEAHNDIFDDMTGFTEEGAD